MGTKIFDTSLLKDILKKYEELWCEIRDLIRSISITVVYGP